MLKFNDFIYEVNVSGALRGTPGAPPPAAPAAPADPTGGLETELSKKIAEFINKVKSLSPSGTTQQQQDAFTLKVSQFALKQKFRIKTKKGDEIKAMVVQDQQKRKWYQLVSSTNQDIQSLLTPTQRQNTAGIVDQSGKQIASQQETPVIYFKSLWTKNGITRLRFYNSKDMTKFIENVDIQIETINSIV